jgi:insecticidal toxin complex protein TccC
VESTYAGAQNALRMNLVENSGVLTSYFGPAFKQVTNRLFDYWGRSKRLAAEYKGSSGSGKFIGATTDIYSNVASVNQADSYGRITLNMSHINAEHLTDVLAHEVLHLGWVSGLNAEGVGAVDNFYLDNSVPGLLGARARPREISHQHLSQVIMDGGLTVNYLEAFTISHDHFVEAVQVYAGGATSVMDLRSAVSEFNRDHYLRAEIAINNADSIAYAAKSMNQLYQARRADSQLFHSVLNE